MISRQKLIEVINEHLIGEMRKQVVEIINLQPPADQWIPCSERLPEECDVYWTTVKPNCSYEPFVTTLAYYPSIEEWEDGVEVLAWMPAELPEPYKGVE